MGKAAPRRRRAARAAPRARRGPNAFPVFDPRRHPLKPQVMKGLLKIYKPALERGANVLAIAPLAAPGFVSQ
jgi:hypothetical protein